MNNSGEIEPVPRASFESTIGVAIASLPDGLFRIKLEENSELRP